MTYKIALIPGDGIGIPVVEAALQVAEAVAPGLLETTRFDWSCDTYLATGRMMPEDGIETLRGFDAIFLGAVGWPARVPNWSRFTVCCCRSARPSCNTPMSGRTGCCAGSRGR